MTDQYKVGQNNRVFSAAFEVHILFTQAVSLGLVFGFLFTRASVYGKPESENATDFPAKKGDHGPRRSMCRPRKLGTRTRHCSLVTEFGVLGRKFWQVAASIAPYTFISHTTMPIFSLKGGSSSYILQSQPGKLMLETFS